MDADKRVDAIDNPVNGVGVAGKADPKLEVDCGEALKDEVADPAAVTGPDELVDTVEHTNEVAVKVAVRDGDSGVATRSQAVQRLCEPIRRLCDECTTERWQTLRTPS